MKLNETFLPDPQESEANGAKSAANGSSSNNSTPVEAEVKQRTSRSNGSAASAASASRRRDPSPTASDEENEVPVKKSKHQQQSVGGSTFTLHPIKPPFHWSSMTSFLFRANQGMGFKGEQHPGYQVADCLSTNETNTLALS